MSRAIVISGLVVLATLIPVRASDDHSRRATVTSERARQIAGDLFPDKCGNSGNACFITFDDRRGCPFEFVVLFPVEKTSPGEPSGAFVTLDKNGGVVDLSSKKKDACHDTNG